MTNIAAKAWSLSPGSDGRLYSYPVHDVTGFDPEPGFLVDGDFVVGGVITITGAGFGTKPGNGKPLFVYDYESGDSGLSVSRCRGSGPTPYIAAGCLFQSAVKPPFGVQSYQMDASGNTTPFTGSYFTLPGTQGTTRYIFTREHTNFNGEDQRAAWYSSPGGQPVGGPTPNIKYYRWNAPGMLGEQEVFTGSWNADKDNDPAMSPGAYLAVDPGSNYAISVGQSMQYMKDGWTAFQSCTKLSGVDVKDGFMQLIADGVGSSQVAMLNFDATYPGNYSRMAAFQVQFSYLSTALYWGSFYYIDDSLCRVMVTDRATWDLSTPHLQEVQFLETWSDTVVSLELRLGALGTLNDKYVWLVDNTNTPRLVGRIL